MEEGSTIGTKMKAHNIGTLILCVYVLNLIFVIVKFIHFQISVLPDLQLTADFQSNLS